jgi:hypothetical protein
MTDKVVDIRFENEIEWDGRSLSVWAVTHRGRVLCGSSP